MRLALKVRFQDIDFDSFYGYALQEFKKNHAYYMCNWEKPSRRDVPTHPVTVGMRDEHFDLWMRSQRGFPVPTSENEKLQLRGLFMSIPPKKSRHAA